MKGLVYASTFKCKWHISGYLYVSHFSLESLPLLTQRWCVMTVCLCKCQRLPSTSITNLDPISQLTNYCHQGLVLDQLGLIRLWMGSLCGYRGVNESEHTRCLEFKPKHGYFSFSLGEDIWSIFVKSKLAAGIKIYVCCTQTIKWMCLSLMWRLEQS